MRRYKAGIPGEPGREKRKCSLFGRQFDDPALNIDRSLPESVRRVPGKTIVGNREREASVLKFLVLEDTTNNFPIQGSVQKTCPKNKGGVREVGRGWTSQSPLVTVNELRSIRKTVVLDEQPLFPAGRVVKGLGLEEGSGSSAVGKRDKVISRTVQVHGGLSEQRDRSG